jgi:ribosomal protein L10
LGSNLVDLKQANALIFCQKDEYQPLKIINDFDLEYHGKNKINGGIYEQKFISGVTLEE